MQEAKKARLLYDGDCPMCTAFAGHVRPQDNAPELINAHTIDTPPVPLERLLEEIHLYEEDGGLRTGSDAILTTMGRTHSWFMPIAHIFRLPGLKQVAQHTYRFVARRRRLWFGNETSRLYWTFLITNLGLLASILLTWPLWGYDRTYPLVPIIPELSSIAPYSTLLAAILVITVLYSLTTTTRQRESALIASLLLILLVSNDITRLQPWVWHYGILLTLFSFWHPTNRTSTVNLLTAAGFIIVGIYFWSGIQKMNVSFYLDVFPWFTETLWEPLGTFGMYLFFTLGVFVPIIESTIAVGLLSARFRRTALITATAMFILVISSLMVGRDWNSSVWPWNLALLAMTLVIFGGSKDTLHDLWRKTKRNYFAHITIALFIVMPLGNFFGITHHYLSWSLYSGHVPTAYLTTDTALAKTLSPNAPIIPSDNGYATLPFVYFSIYTLNAAPYPETWVFESLFNQLCETYPEHELTLDITTYSLFNSRHTETEQYDCPY